MKYVKYCIVFIIGMSILPFIAHAECDYQRKAELSRIAGNVKLAYEYDVKEELKFSVKITNITNDIYLVDGLNNTFSGSSEMSHRYKDGQTVRYTIYSNDNNCRGEELLTQYISLPYYNIYHDYSSCKLHPNHNYCKMWSDTRAVSRDKFEQVMYAETLKKNIASINEEENETFVDNILDFINEYKFIIIITGVVILIIVIGLLIRRHIRKL